MKHSRNLRPRISFVVVEINWNSVFQRESKHRIQNPTGGWICIGRGGKFHMQIQRLLTTAGTSQRVFTGVGCRDDKPGFFVFRAVKGLRVVHQFNKGILHRILCVKLVDSISAPSTLAA